MIKTSSCGKVTPSMSSRVNIIISCHEFGRQPVIRTYFLYFFFPLPLSPLVEVPPKITLISNNSWLGWLDSSPSRSARVSLLTNCWTRSPWLSTVRSHSSRYSIVRYHASYLRRICNTY